MTLLLRGAAFVLGLYLSIRLIASLHGVVDMWYAIGREWPRVLARILGWGGLALVLAWSFDADCRAALAAGLAGFLALYLSLFVIRYPLLRALREANRDSQPSNQSTKTTA